jgi:cytochrome c
MNVRLWWIGATLLVVGCQAGPPQAPAQAKAEAPAARGEYLAGILACGDCHTPLKMGHSGPEPDLARLLSGHPEGMTMPPAPTLPDPWGWVGSATNTAYAGPWGVTYAPNLTPDELTGMGIWTEEMFVTAMRTGRHMGTSRPIMPPMPWPSYAKLPDDDLKAIYAYLRSVPPIRNQAPSYQEPAP